MKFNNKTRLSRVIFCYEGGVRSWMFAASALTICGFFACSSAGSGGGQVKPPGENTTLADGTVFRRADLLKAFGECAAKQAQQTVAPAERLVQAIEALQAQDDEPQRQAAHTAYKAAFSQWQQSETLQYGPGGVKDRAGGRDLRDQMHSWPLTSRCAVSERLVRGNYAEGLASALVTTRGFDALEFLLFYPGQDSGCAQNHAIHSDGSWAALSPAQLRAKRLQAALAVAKLLPVTAQELADAWDENKGNFLAEFTSAGRGSRTFGTDSQALNTVSDALFYIEYEVKDMKLAQPMGLRQCDDMSCPEDVESPHAKLSLPAIRSNLIGARYLLQGCGEDFSGLGFDDMLRAVGQDALANEMVQAVQDAILAVDAIEGDDLATSLSSQRDKVDALYAAIKRITDRLKTDFLSVLDLEIARTVEGDND